MSLKSNLMKKGPFSLVSKNTVSNQRDLFIFNDLLKSNMVNNEINKGNGKRKKDTESVKHGTWNVWISI